MPTKPYQEAKSAEDEVRLTHVYKKRNSSVSSVVAASKMDVFHPAQCKQGQKEMAKEHFNCVKKS